MSGRLALFVAAIVLALPGVAGAAPTAVFGTCPPGTASTARCGTVAVPLDRSDPASRTIPIAFVLTPHTGSGPAVSAIVLSNGGPGVSNIGSDPLWRARLSPALKDHDMLAIDHRGIGASAAIDCPALQHVQGDQLDAARKCGESLGAASDRYGSGDVADDVDDVRAALGIDKIDYYGVSYGPVDVRAYAYRHPDHLHAAVLDSPDFSSDDAFFRTLPGAMAKITVRVCQRSPACTAGEKHPAKTLAALVARVRSHPVSGTGFDAAGKARRVKIDEVGLLNILYDDYFADPAFLNQGELFAAAHALAAGDKTPLLRLAAESNAPTDFGPSDGSSSVGADYAVFCSDSVFPWDKSAPEATRRAQYEAAARAVPDSATAPFTVAAWTGFVASQPVLLIPGANACTPWPAPRRPEAPFPPEQPWPAGIPALLMGGGLDYLDDAAERTLLRVFPTGTPFVTIANGGHVTSLWSNCAAGIAVHFLRTLQVGSTKCASDTQGQTGMPFGAALGKLQIQGVSAFPRRAGKDPRRVAALAWDTVEDAVYQSFRLTGKTGRGLRGGTFTVRKDKIVLKGARFADDVHVTGQVTFTRASSRVTGNVSVTGSLPGALRVSATLWDPKHPTASVKGTVGHLRFSIRPASR